MAFLRSTGAILRLQYNCRRGHGAIAFGLARSFNIPLEQHDQVRFLSMYNLHVRFLIAVFRRIRGLWHHRSFRTDVSACSAEISICAGLIRGQPSLQLLSNVLEYGYVASERSRPRIVSNTCPNDTLPLQQLFAAKGMRVKRRLVG